MRSPLTERHCRAEMRPGSGILCGRHKGHDAETKGEDWHRQRGADGGNTWRVARVTDYIPGTVRICNNHGIADIPESQLVSDAAGLIGIEGVRGTVKGSKVLFYYTLDGAMREQGTDLLPVKAMRGRYVMVQRGEGWEAAYVEPLEAALSRAEKNV